MCLGRIAFTVLLCAAKCLVQPLQLDWTCHRDKEDHCQRCSGVHCGPWIQSSSSVYKANGRLLGRQLVTTSALCWLGGGGWASLPLQQQLEGWWLNTDSRAPRLAICYHCALCVRGFLRHTCRGVCLATEYMQNGMCLVVCCAIRRSPLC